MQYLDDDGFGPVSSSSCSRRRFLRPLRLVIFFTPPIPVCSRTADSLERRMVPEGVGIGRSGGLLERLLEFLRRGFFEGHLKIVYDDLKRPALPKRARAPSFTRKSSTSFTRHSSDWAGGGGGEAWVPA